MASSHAFIPPEPYFRRTICCLVYFLIVVKWCHNGRCDGTNLNLYGYGRNDQVNCTSLAQVEGVLTFRKVRWMCWLPGKER
ncbi:hypothetical protein ASPVEDRAFT_450620 [Aspergillus versicolor CBS 583.65]|uniref:Uncharacterized protein n=1 Tax=Aspergillus versicolor CBS 583.65 TaxID=1036611 RepID=A0A1L9P9P1_ASPVE|nr:uncharacterized protein ASPVEDRAFT_450620 [Aspergillus versicolor CBS 583.65]OJI98241.1 hypothetical protein ASPVEDRAFT_450620 [Aspergillus versicolor CBS 583.65]